MVENNLPSNFALSILSKDEIGLILYFKTDSDWFLLSNKKIWSSHRGKTVNLDFKDLRDVTLAIQEEFKDGIRNKHDFNRLRISNVNNKNYIFYLEKGLPYEGFYQVLHYLASRNKDAIR